jgi:hypothetical protein
MAYGEAPTLSRGDGDDTEVIVGEVEEFEESE